VTITIKKIKLKKY